MKKRKVFKSIIIALLILAILSVVAVFSINAYVKSVGKKLMVTPESATELKNVDCILVLGCGVRDDGTPSDMLRDRLERSIELYFSGVAPKLLMSGDHGRVEYDEVNIMKQYAIDKGVPSEDVFMDHAGFSTYESIYRAKEIFCADNIVIVTQEYHLYRALYLAKSFGLEAHGVSSDYYIYAGQTMRDIREILARNKDFFTAIFKPYPTYLGEAIPVNGDGNLTND
ncbi:MAG: YdcF family protein [Clostridia bacterium]|nr:YdcF family protein [Clostridia bacterium]